MVFKTKIFSNIIILTSTAVFVYLILIKISNYIYEWLVAVIVTYFICLFYILVEHTKSYKIQDGMIFIETFFDSFQIKIYDILCIKAIWEVSRKGYSTDYMIIMKSPGEESFKIDVFLKNEDNKYLLTVLQDEFNIMVNKV